VGVYCVNSRSEYLYVVVEQTELLRRRYASVKGDLLGERRLVAEKRD